jgi:hypothetical protein
LIITSREATLEAEEAQEKKRHSMVSEATLLEIHVMNDAENAILPAEAMHDADENKYKKQRGPRPICRGKQIRRNQSGRSL